MAPVMEVEGPGIGVTSKKNYPPSASVSTSAFALNHILGLTMLQQC